MILDEVEFVQVSRAQLRCPLFSRGLVSLAIEADEL